MESKNVYFAALLSSLMMGCQSPSQPTATATQPSPNSNVVQSSTLMEQSSTTLAWSPQDGLENLLQRVAVESPQVRQAHQAWQIALQRVPQVTALPDPWISLSAYVQSVETRTGPMDGKIGIRQNFPWPGTLDAAGNEASALAEVTRLRIDAERLFARRQFLRHWSEHIYLQEAKGIRATQIVLLEHIENVSLRLYETSLVTQADVLRAQVERLKMSDHLESLHQREVVTIASMSAALGAPLAESASWESVDFSTSVNLLDEAQLHAALLQTSPDLSMMRARLLATQHARDLAQLDGRPDFSLGADWTWIGDGNPTLSGSGDDAFAVTLALELPLGQGRVDGRRHQALAEQRQVLAQIENRQWQLLAQLQESLAAHKDAVRRIELFEQRLIPLSQQTYETTLTAYQIGQADFQDTLDAARDMLDFRLSSARASADAARAYADLNGILPESVLLAEPQDQ